VKAQFSRGAKSAILLLEEIVYPDAYMFFVSPTCPG
jgi:hypothetical protein